MTTAEKELHLDNLGLWLQDSFDIDSEIEFSNGCGTTRPEQALEAFNSLREELADYTNRVGSFSLSDVRNHLSKNESIALNDEEIKEFMQYLQDNYDASVGMDWDTITQMHGLWKDPV